MDHLLTTILASVLAFVSTNLDEVFLLIMFFSDRTFSVRQVVVGQSAGYAVLVAVSLLCAAISFIVPPEWIGLLGLVPLGLGVRRLVTRRGCGCGCADGDELPPPDRRGTWAIMVIAIAHGGDNFGVYIPFFAAQSPWENLLTIGIFAAMMAVWIVGARRLIAYPQARRRLERLAPPCIPWVLIGLGLWILSDSLPLVGLGGE
jgi:cadmium resistance protein CadD (predicted permease)